MQQQAFPSSLSYTPPPTPPHPSLTQATLWAIVHVVGCCSLVFHILNKLLSPPKTNCVLFVSGPTMGILQMETNAKLWATLKTTEALGC